MGGLLVAKPFELPEGQDEPLPLTTLLAIANVDEWDLDAAIVEWFEDPPDVEFKTILNAEILDTQA